ncbi:MAG TPA: DMT family transporter [Bryobacteraceae bacterium]|jgi:drug/metabolite transporter (DMT)-like permease|nr:DMT family transporter [Bryobacteraceae bacterium]
MNADGRAGASQPSERPALLWVALGASLWGTDTVIRQPLTAALTSGRIVLIEHLILTALLAIPLWTMRAQWLVLTRRQWAALLGVAWGGSALGTVCFTEAIRIGNPTTAALLQKTQPLFAALLAWLLLHEHLGKNFWVCLSIAMCGAYLVSFGLQAPGAVREPRAALLAISAAALWGGSTALGRFALERLSFFAMTALRIVLATPLLVAVNGASTPPRALHSKDVVSLVLLALIPGLLALLVYYRGLRHARASRAAVAELSFSATAALLNWVFLGTRVSLIQIGGFALLWGSILSLNRRGANELNYAKREHDRCLGIPQ